MMCLFKLVGFCQCYVGICNVLDAKGNKRSPKFFMSDICFGVLEAFTLEIAGSVDCAVERLPLSCLLLLYHGTLGKSIKSEFLVLFVCNGPVLFSEKNYRFSLKRRDEDSQGCVKVFRIVPGSSSLLKLSNYLLVDLMSSLDNMDALAVLLLVWLSNFVASYCPARHAPCDQKACGLCRDITATIFLEEREAKKRRGGGGVRMEGVIPFVIHAIRGRRGRSSYRRLRTQHLPEQEEGAAPPLPELGGGFSNRYSRGDRRTRSEIPASAIECLCRSPDYGVGRSRSLREGGGDLLRRFISSPNVAKSRSPPF
ncbi:hypothetical protein MUK42_34753 [Musa troglodytarum]|uniref:Uncharacterized protein n=1 Tax=Musa troglodytarum TaxID=320322 RepID=A0A9E7EG95_9LILI|nr:hypothetical protein MUK42_34753 [Musa troglodytarum]